MGSGGWFKTINPLINTTPALRATPPRPRRGVRVSFRLYVQSPYSGFRGLQLGSVDFDQSETEPSHCAIVLNLHRSEFMKTFCSVLCLAVLAASASAQSARDVTEVPMSFTKLEILMQVTLNGQGPFTLLLDTGCTVTFITPEVAAKLGLKVHQKGTEVRGTQTAKGYATRLASIRTGELEAHDVEAFVQDQKPIDGLPNNDGCLGYSFLKRWAVQIDYRAGVVRFFSTAPPEGAGDVKFRLHDTNVIDDIRVNGVSFQAAIDTGQDFPFSLLPKPAKTLKVETVAGTSFAMVKSLTVGSLPAQQLVVNVIRSGEGYDKFSFGVTIGNSFLKDYILTMDYPRNVVSFRAVDH